MHRVIFPMRSLAVVHRPRPRRLRQRRTGKAAAPPPAPSVGVVPVHQRDVTPTMTFNGRVEAVDTVELLARGRRLPRQGGLHRGRRSEGGATCCSELEKDQYRASVLQAQGAVKQAEAALTEAQLQLDRALAGQGRNIPQAEVDSRRAKRDDPGAADLGAG